MLRLVQAQGSEDLDFADQLLLGVTFLNGQPRPPTSFSACELFNYGSSQWPDCVPSFSGPGFQGEICKAFKALSDKMASERAYWERKKNKNQYRKANQFIPGSFAWVHHRRFPGHPRLKTDPILLGPFRIKKVEGREIYIGWNENEFRVEVSQAKPWE